MSIVPTNNVLRVLLTSVYFVCTTRILAISAQGTVQVGFDQDFAAFNNTDDFERICEYSGSSSQFQRLEWLLNDSVYLSRSDMTFQLLIQRVTFSHAGQWTCRAVFTDGSLSNSVNGGTVTIFDTNDVDAPPQQYALLGQEYTFQCSSTIQGSFNSLLNGSSTTSLTIQSVQLSHEGEYTCRVSIQGASINKPVQLSVLVPPQILSFPQLNGQIFTNEQVTLTVNFQSHQEATTTIRWFHNDIPINPNITTTTYGSAPNGITQINFAQITRENRGTYRVEVENSAEAIPTGMRRAVAMFEVNVQVPPSPPSGVTVNLVNATHVVISWTLTNQTSDAGADTLTLHLQDHPNSPFVISPAMSEWIVYSEPGMMYNLSLKATNPDGVVNTDPIKVNLPPTGPAVDNFRALRVNDTAFNLTLTVIYTGGGDIKTFAVRFRENQMSQWAPAGVVVPVQSQLSSRLWYTVLSNNMFQSIEEPQFEVIIENTMGQSTPFELQGEIVLPGPPTILLVSRSSDSLTLQVRISDIGTAPITIVQMNITSSLQPVYSKEWKGNYVQGELLEAVEITDLEPNTFYACRVRAMSSHGVGNFSLEFEFNTDAPPNVSLIPMWIIIVIAVCGSIILTAVIVTAILCLIYCCRRNSGKRIYNTAAPYISSGELHKIPEDVRNSSETLNSASYRGSVRGGVVGCNTQISVPLTPRSPTTESACDSPYIKQRFESVTDSDGSKSDIQPIQPQVRHYTCTAFSPGIPAYVPTVTSLKFNYNNRLSRSMTAFTEPTSPKDVTLQATMV